MDELTLKIEEAQVKLQETNDAINRANLSLESLLDKKREAESDFKITIEKIFDQIRTSKEDLNSISKELRSKTDSFEIDVFSAQNDRDAKKKDIQDEVVKINSEIEAFRIDANQKKEFMISELQLASGDHESKMTSLSTEHDSLVGKIDDLREKALTLGSFIDELTNEKDQIEISISIKTTEIAQYEKTSQDAHEESLKIVKDLDTTKNSLELLLSEISKKQDYIDELNGKIPDLESKHEKMITMLEKDTPEYQAYIAERTSFSAQVANLKQKEVAIKNKYKQIGLNYD